VVLAGLTLTATGGYKVIVAVVVLLVSDWLVAVTFTVCIDPTVAGAVYKPAALIVPAPVAGLRVHVTAELHPPVTNAVNCCIWPPYSAAAAGERVTVTGGNTCALDGFSLIPTPPSKSTVRATSAVFPVLLDPLLNVREVVGKYKAPVRFIEAPPAKVLDSAVLLMLRSWKNRMPW
jgi:hypothetical protein